MSQDVPPFMTVAGNPLAVHGFNAEGLRRRGFSRERIALVKQMHRLLYRDGLTLDEARARHRGRWPGASRGDADVRCCWTSWRPPRAASCADGPPACNWPWWPARPRATCSPACCWAACGSAGPICRPQGIGGPRDGRAGLPGLVAARQAGRARLCRVLRHYREISGIRQALAKRLLHERPAAFIGVDAPDFNLDLEAGCKAAGIKTIHFICPSIWAWRGGRA
jgi:hypothetical protein